MSELNDLQERFWQPFLKQLAADEGVLNNPQYDDRNLKFYVFGPKCWLEAIVNFGHASRENQSVAVSLVVQPESAYQLTQEPSIKEVIEIEGEERVVRWWSDETVEGRRTIKLSRAAPEIRESSKDWGELHEWLSEVLRRFHDVFGRILTI